MRTGNPCVICGSINTWRGGSQKKTCGESCENKLTSFYTKGKNNPMWTGGLPKCKDCGKELSRYKPQKGRRYEHKGRCRYCHNLARKTKDARTNANIYTRRIMRGAIKHSVFGKGKPSKYEIYTGCSPKELRVHIEKQFWPHMTWENFGHKGWHLDHIKPLSSFDLTKEEDRFKAFHYTNLQPLWWFMNLSKGGKVIGEHKPDYSNSLKCGHAGKLLYFLATSEKGVKCYKISV